MLLKMVHERLGILAECVVGDPSGFEPFLQVTSSFFISCLVFFLFANFVLGLLSI